MATNKIIILKDKDGNSLYPKILQNSIPAEAVTKAKLAKEVTDILNSVATDANLQSLKNDVDILKGGNTVTGSVDQKVKAAIDNLVGTAPDTLNTLQKIAQELTDPSKNTAATVLDQVASKANSADLTAEITRAKAAEKANSDSIAAINAKLLLPMLTYEEVIE
jgi:hypothetical protein